MSEDLNIYQKMAKIRKPVEILKKNRRGYGYTYVDEEEILSKITGLMEKYNVSLIPCIIPNSLTAEPHHYTKTKVKKEDGPIYDEHVCEIIVKGDMEFHWVNNENPEERIDVTWAMVGSQADASQAFGAGLTYATRYFLLKYFNIATSDNDPDNWRSRQREAEQQEDKLIAEKIVSEIHKLVTEHLAISPDDKKRVVDITKKYVRENGKATANYYAIQSPVVATELLNALKAELNNNKEEK